MKLKITNLKEVFILFILMFFIWGLISEAWDYKITHEYPTMFLAQDAFWHLTYSRYVFEEKNLRYQPPFMAYHQEDMVAGQPPLYYHFCALLKGLTGLNMWDINFLVAGLAIVLIILIYFNIIFDYNKKVALFSLPLIVFVTVFPFYKNLAWGWHIAIIGQLFMVASFYVLYNWSRLKYPYVLYLLTLAFIILTHSEHLLYALGFLGFFIAFKIVIERVSIRSMINTVKKDYLKIISALLVFIVCCGYYFLLFKNVWLYSKWDAGYFSNLLKPYSPPWAAKLSSFGFYLVPILIGLIFVVLLIFSTKNIRLALPLYLFVVSLVTYIGIRRAIRIQFLMPIFFSTFFGFFVYFLISKIKLSMDKCLGLSIILFILFFPLIHEPLPQNASITNRYSWEAFNWIKSNVPKEKEVVIIHDQGGSTQGAMLWNIFHVPIVVSLQKSNEAINLTFFGYAGCDVPGATWAIYKTPFTFEHIPVPENTCGFAREDGFDFELCEFEYIYVGRSNDPNLNNYLMAIINNIVSQEQYETIFSNQQVVVFKNNAVGECA